MGFQRYRLPARKHSKRSKTLQTLQNPPNTFQTLQTPSPTGTPGPRPLLKQAPQGQGHSNGFLLAFKAAVCQPANTPNAPKPSKPSKPSKHPPKPCKPSKPSKTFQTLQTPSPAGTPGPRPLPQQAPLSKLPFARPQTLQTFQNLPNLPNPPNTFPSRHPRAKATSPTGTPRPRPQQWLSMGFQSCRLPACKRSKPSKTFQTLQTLQNLPNPPNTFPSRLPRAKATSPTGTPGPRPLLKQAPQGQGHSNGLLWAFKAAVCPPANAPNLPKPSKPSNPSRHPRAKATSPTGTPGPG